MPRELHKLGPKAAETITKPGRHSDGGGLYLSVSKDGSRRRWVFFYQRDGKQREAGLGHAGGKGGVPLKAARETAAEGRAWLKAGLDPIAEWAKAKTASPDIPTFGEAADDYIVTHEGSWRNDKSAAQWKMTLTKYCAPIRSKPVDTIDTGAVLSVLKPLWKRAPETAARLRGRIETVLDAARARGFIDADKANPARWRGHLDKLLPRKAAGEHFAAMDYKDVPAFVRRLREEDGIVPLALEFLILTAARSGEVFGATFAEIDIETKIWTIPKERTKSHREHRVPLSDRALEIVAQMEAIRTGPYLFPGRNLKKPLSSMAFTMLLRRMGAGAVAHGFRSSFRDWVGNETSFPRELAEHALAHVIGDKAEQAYDAATRWTGGAS
jgi:integrase